MINLILFGPPGSGKGTQAAKLVQRYNLLHISTGDLFRYEISNKTELGIQAQSFMDKGELVPDEVTIGMLKNKVDANPGVDGYIFDGFPRTVPQAKALNSLLKERGEEITVLLELDVQDKEIVKRLLLRAETSGRSDDANEEIIRNRIQIYNDNTRPVAEFYAGFGKAIKVIGIGSIDEIFERLSSEIDAIVFC